MTNQRRAVVAGWNGFIGRALVHDLAARGYDVVRVGRTGPDVRWADGDAALARVVDGADLLVNLAGKSVGCRYTDANRDEILRSRTDTTRALHGAVAAASAPPRLWLNASTATIYRYATDRPQTEADGELGTGFSVDVARSWERELFAGDLPGTRRVALRMAIVLGGPASDMLARIARLGVGGPQLDGWWFQHRRDPVHRRDGHSLRAGQPLGTEPERQPHAHGRAAPCGADAGRPAGAAVAAGACPLGAAQRGRARAQEPVGAARTAHGRRLHVPPAGAGARARGRGAQAAALSHVRRGSGGSAHAAGSRSASKSASAAPSSSTVPVTRAATARTASGAWPIAIGTAAHANISRSFSP